MGYNSCYNSICSSKPRCDSFNAGNNIGIISAISFFAAAIVTSIYNRLGASDGKDEETRGRENMNFARAILSSTLCSSITCLALNSIEITPTFTVAALGTLALTWFFGEYAFCAVELKNPFTTCRNPGITQKRISYYIQESSCANEWLSIPVFGQRVIDLCQECIEVLKETVGLERSVA